MVQIDDIRQAASAVAQANGASCAILFGSYARGTATERSDIDIIFVEQTGDPFLKRLDRYIGPLVDRLHTSVEALVYTPDEFERMKDRSFVRTALEEGVVLYESGEVPPRGRPLVSAGEGGPESRREQRRVG